jgi:hypothetical protein
MVQGLTVLTSTVTSAIRTESISTYYGRARHIETVDYDTGQENDNISRCEREEEGVQVPARNLPDGA